MGRRGWIELLDGVTAAVSSEWFFIADFDRITIEFEGMEAGDIVNICVSNKNEKPETSDHGTPVLDSEGDADITEDCMKRVDPGMRWLKARVTNATGGGPVTARMQLR